MMPLSLRVPLAGQAEDEAGLHVVLEHRAIHAADGRRDDVVEVELGVQVALHRVEAQLDLRDARAAVLLADHLVDGALDRRGRALNLLRPLVHDLQVAVEAVHLVGRRGDQLDELEVVLHRQLEALLVGDGPEDVRGDGAADVNVQVDQLAGHGFECHIVIPGESVVVHGLAHGHAEEEDPEEEGPGRRRLPAKKSAPNATKATSKRRPPMHAKLDHPELRRTATPSATRPSRSSSPSTATARAASIAASSPGCSRRSVRTVPEEELAVALDVIDAEPLRAASRGTSSRPGGQRAEGTTASAAPGTKVSSVPGSRST